MLCFKFKYQKTFSLCLYMKPSTDMLSFESVINTYSLILHPFLATRVTVLRVLFRLYGSIHTFHEIINTKTLFAGLKKKNEIVFVPLLSDVRTNVTLIHFKYWSNKFMFLCIYLKKKLSSSYKLAKP